VIGQASDVDCSLDFALSCIQRASDNGLEPLVLSDLWPYDCGAAGARLLPRAVSGHQLFVNRNVLPFAKGWIVEELIDTLTALADAVAPG
jgi:hypothetical protein